MRKLLAAAAVALVAARSAAQPLSRQQVLELVEKGVAEDLVRSLVACACVDFVVDEASLVELRRELPAAVVAAMIECRGGTAARPEGDGAPPATLPGAASATPLTPPAPRPSAQSPLGVVAVAPIVLDGESDPELTTYLIDQARARRPSWTLLDAPQLALATERPEAAGERIDAPATRDAARELGAQAMLLVQGRTGTSAMGSTEVLLELRLVALDGGALLWSASGSSEGSGLTRKHAARLAVRAALKKLPE